MRIFKYGSSKNKTNNNNNNHAGHHNSTSVTDLNADDDGPPYDSQPFPIGERTSSTSSWNIFKRNKLKKLKSAPPVGIQSSTSMISLPKNYDAKNYDQNQKFPKNFDPKNFDAKNFDQKMFDGKSGYEPTNYYDQNNNFKNTQNNQTFNSKQTYGKGGQHLPLQEKDSSATIKNENLDSVESVHVGSDREASDEESNEDDSNEDSNVDSNVDSNCLDDTPDDTPNDTPDDTPNEDTSMGSLGGGSLGEDKCLKKKRGKKGVNRGKPSIQSSTRSGITTSSGCQVSASSNGAAGGGKGTTKTQSHHSSGYSSAYSNSNYTSTGRHRASTCSTTSSNSPKNCNNHHNSNNNNSNGNSNNNIQNINQNTNPNPQTQHMSTSNNHLASLPTKQNFGQAVGSLLRRLSGSRANSQTRLNKISQDNHKTGQFTPGSLLQGLTLGGSRTSLAKLGKNSGSTNDDSGILVKKNFSASVQCLTQNNTHGNLANSLTNGITNGGGGGLAMQGLNSGSRVNISNILNSGQTSSNAHLFYTKNAPAPLVRGPGVNPKYGSAVNLSGNVDDQSLEGKKRGNSSKSRTHRAGSQSKINDNDYRSGSIPPDFPVAGTPCQLEYPNRFRGASDYIQIQMEEFKAKYEVTGIIGRGGGGTVYSGYRRLDRSPCAIKQVPKVKVKRWGRINNLKVPIEFDLLNRVNRKHSSIIEMLDWYERRSSFVLVMERPPHSIDLFEFINRRGAVEEFNTKYMLRQLVEVMIILFKEGVFHRDVKDENIMVSYDNFQLKLIDFGCGTNLKKSDYTEFAGTPEFYPPEWFREKRYSAETQTVWSLGVLLWAMLHGEVPFANEGDIKVYKGSVYELKRRVQLTEDTMHFLQKLLNFDERKRPTLRQLINSRWLRKNSEGDEKLSITPAYEGSSLRKGSNKHENSNKHSSHNSKQQQHQTTSHQDLSSYATSHNPQHSQHQHFASTTQLNQKKEEQMRVGGGGQHHSQHRSSKQHKNTNSYNRFNTSLFQTSAATAVAPPPTTLY